jgi:hypothetical protein
MFYDVKEQRRGGAASLRLDVQASAESIPIGMPVSSPLDDPDALHAMAGRLELTRFDEVVLSLIAEKESPIIPDSTLSVRMGAYPSTEFTNNWIATPLVREVNGTDKRNF